MRAWTTARSRTTIDRAASATITLDRPDQLNAFTEHDMNELLDAFDRADADDDVRAVVVTGRGQRLLRRSRSLRRCRDLQPGRQRRHDRRRRSSRRWRSGHTADLPVDQAGDRRHQRSRGRRRRHHDAADGPTAGIGAGPHRLRVRPSGHRARGVLVLVPAPSGRHPAAAEWVFTGRVFGADEALAGGLVRSVHPPDELLPAAYALAGEIADHTAPVSVALSRQMLWRMLGADHPMAAHRADSRGILDRGRSADVAGGRVQLPREAAGGVHRSRERRPPRPLPRLGGPRVRLRSASGASACGPSSRRRGRSA